MSNIFRQVGAGKTFLSPTDFYVQVNTNDGGEVELVLPNITSILSNINTSIYQYIGIRFVDSSSNASVNNIVLTGFDGQKINGSNQVRLNTNGVGGLLTLIGENQWSFNANAMLGSGVSEYQTALLPSATKYPSSRTDINYGYYFDNLPSVIHIPKFPTLVKLNNGSLANVNYCQSILYDGTLIYEGYDIFSTDINYGYWIAFQVNPLDETELIKVAELPMTQQFWDNWYNYTYKDPAITNQVKLVTYSNPSSDTNLAESYITTLTYSNGVLTATDTFIDFGGVTFGQMFNNLSGQNSVNYQWWNPTGIADDDYYGMGYGSQAGWVYFVGSDLLQPFQYFCSYNLLTGETRTIDVIASLLATTNLNPNPLNYPYYFGKFIYAHSQGVLFFVYDGNIPNNGNNTIGVTAMWSPYWTNNTEVSFINSRNGNDINFTAFGGDITDKNWYWDGFNLYIFQLPSNGSGELNTIGFWKFEMNSQKSSYLELPIVTGTLSLNQNSWAFDDGCLLTFYNNSLTINSYFGIYEYYYYKAGELKPYHIQTNNSYPTNMIGNTSYSAYSQLNTNAIRLGLQYDEYEDITFTK